MTESYPAKTIAEKLDAAETREEWLDVLNGLFVSLETAKDKTP